jgi:glycosyltransferase involved in cell wall biosynthesis
VSVLAEQALSPVPGGTGRYSLGLSAALARTAGPGDVISGWVAWHRDTGPAEVPGVGGPYRFPLPRRALALAWQRGIGPTPRRADLVHAPTLLAPPRRGRGLIVTIHDAVPWTHPETMTPRGAAWHIRMAGIVAAEADAVVVPTRAVATQLAVVLPELEARRVHVIAQGVTAALSGAGRYTEQESASDPAGQAIRASLQLPPRYLLSLATLEPRKGLDVLLEALADPGAPDIALVVVGQPGWGGVDLDAQARALGVSDRVLQLGRLSDERLAAVLAGATVLVMPSRAEGFGLPVLEAMAAGVPAVTSDDPALVEVGGGAAAVTPRGDHAALAQVLARLCGDDQLRERMAKDGIVRSRDFDWDACARRMWALYARITGKRG